MPISLQNTILYIDSDSSGSVLEANSFSETYAIVQLKDSSGNNFASGLEDVEFFATKGMFAYQFDSSDGSYRALYIADSGSGTSIITATVNGNLIEDNAIITLVPGAVYYENCEIETSDNSFIKEVGSVELTLTVKDSSGNIVNVGGHDVVFESFPSGSFTSIIDNDDGTYQTYFSAIDEGEYLVSATIDGTLIGNTLEIDAVPEKARDRNNPVDGFLNPPGSGGGSLPFNLTGINNLPFATFPNLREARSLLRDPNNRGVFVWNALVSKGIVAIPSGLPLPKGISGAVQSAVKTSLGGSMSSANPLRNGPFGAASGNNPFKE